MSRNTSRAGTILHEQPKGVAQTMIAHMVPIGSLNYGDQVRVGEDVLTFAGRKLSGFAPDEYTVTLLDGTGTPLGFLRFETDELERVRPDLVLDVQGDPA